jgi:7,8-dihydroneopterin aldolase/epimerase/oxygenase
MRCSPAYGIEIAKAGEPLEKLPGSMQIHSSSQFSYMSMDHQSLSCIRLVNMVFYAHHGVLQEEHVLGAKYEIDAELFFDFSEAAQHDSIANTVDYGAAYSKIREIFLKKRYSLIESAAFDLAECLLSDFALIEEVTVRIRKHNPPLNGLCDYAEAVCQAKRH